MRPPLGPGTLGGCKYKYARRGEELWGGFHYRKENQIPVRTEGYCLRGGIKGKLINTRAKL